ncbi:MAG: methyltransferase domain-containing protein [Chloroflexi bacterium]|nr:methyltransferase domain-containing protein [Chloroflexota bacterium]MCI0575316.1 methyltransferase domain-containing protein [Chloroflexota bacterium]MCI0649781.1 methyltransferase domain-containing protein [Chloroflexota bacterium]
MDFDYLRFLAKVGAAYIHPHEKKATDILIQELKLKHGQKVLELGCGTGGTIVRIAGRFKVKMYGVDKLDEMLAMARQRIRITGLPRRVCLFKGNLSALPFGGATFDRVYAESVIGILSSRDIEAVLDEVYRVLGGQGCFVLNDAIWKKSISPEQVQVINRACLEDFGLLQASEAAWSVDDWHEIFRRHGFQVQSFLIEECLKPGNRSLQSAMNWRDVASETLSKAYKISGYLNRGLLFEKKKYSQLLKQHQDDGKYIESRIFVLSKN